MIDTTIFLGLLGVFIGGLFYTLAGFFTKKWKSGDERLFNPKYLLNEIPPIVVAYVITIVPILPSFYQMGFVEGFLFGFFGKWVTDKALPHEKEVQK